MMERCEECGVSYTPRPLVQEDEPQPATVPYSEARQIVPGPLLEGWHGVDGAEDSLVQLWRDERAAYDAWQRRGLSMYLYKRPDVDAWLSLPVDDP